ncbi:nuclear pore glycoprotein p62-like isoform X2 [Zophobas morio]|uniref:nuclear pore glycoprotein p62-like isoform X2 n=1 Tax=Zophobas morio TaxID=2755281 RepID=UPI003083E51E
MSFTNFGGTITTDSKSENTNTGSNPFSSSFQTNALKFGQAAENPTSAAPSQTSGFSGFGVGPSTFGGNTIFGASLITTQNNEKSGENKSFSFGNSSEFGTTSGGLNTSLGTNTEKSSIFQSDLTFGKNLNFSGTTSSFQSKGLPTLSTDKTIIAEDKKTSNLPSSGVTSFSLDKTSTFQNPFSFGAGKVSSQNIGSTKEVNVSSVESNPLETKNVSSAANSNFTASGNFFFGSTKTLNNNFSFETGTADTKSVGANSKSNINPLNTDTQDRVNNIFATAKTTDVPTGTTAGNLPFSKENISYQSSGFGSVPTALNSEKALGSSSSSTSESGTKPFSYEQSSTLTGNFSFGSNPVTTDTKVKDSTTPGTAPKILLPILPFLPQKTFNQPTVTTNLKNTSSQETESIVSQSMKEKKNNEAPSTSIQSSVPSFGFPSSADNKTINSGQSSTGSGNFSFGSQTSISGTDDKKTTSLAANIIPSEPSTLASLQSKDAQTSATTFNLPSTASGASQENSKSSVETTEKPTSSFELSTATTRAFPGDSSSGDKLKPATSFNTFSKSEASSAPPPTTSSASSLTIPAGVQASEQIKKKMEEMAKKLDERKIESVLNEWKQTTEVNIQKFIEQAVEIEGIDRQTHENYEKIVTLNRQVDDLLEQQKLLDSKIEFVMSQQDDLDGVLSQIENSLSTHKNFNNMNLLGSADQKRRRLYSLAVQSNKRLTNLEEELKELISDLNRAVLRGADPEDPVSQIVKILNHHMSSLQWIDRNAGQLLNSIEEISSQMDGLKLAHDV